MKESLDVVHFPQRKICEIEGKNHFSPKIKAVGWK
jgi:hypothetical protein